MDNPDSQIVLAHSLGPKFTQLVMFSLANHRLGRARNVWFELSAVAPMFADSPYAEHLAWVLRNHGLDRVVWGSDYPIFTPEEAWTSLTGLGLTEHEIVQV